MNPALYSKTALVLFESNSTSYLPIWVAIFLCIILPMITRKREEMLISKVVKRRKNTQERTKMTELAKCFIERDCIIYFFNGSQYMGTLKAVTDGALLFDKNGEQEVINLDFVARIREYPKKKNGKKRSVVLD